MSIEQLRLGASVIFIRAFEAIYKKVISEKIIRPLNRDDHAMNADLLLDSLREITENSALDSITGLKIADGDHSSISIIVGLLYAEGQRLWAERIKRRQTLEVNANESEAQPKKHEEINIPDRNLKKASDKRKNHGERSKEYQGVDATAGAVENIVTRFYDEPGNKTAPEELMSLMERIKYLVIHEQYAKHSIAFPSFTK